MVLLFSVTSTVLTCVSGLGTLTVTLDRNFPSLGKTSPFSVAVFSSVGTAFTFTFDKSLPVVGITLKALSVGVTVFSSVCTASTVTWLKPPYPLSGRTCCCSKDGETVFSCSMTSPLSTFVTTVTWLNTLPVSGITVCVPFADMLIVFACSGLLPPATLVSIVTSPKILPLSGFTTFVPFSVIATALSCFSGIFSAIFLTSILADESLSPRTLSAIFFNVVSLIIQSAIIPP